MFNRTNYIKYSKDLEINQRIRKCTAVRNKNETVLAGKNLADLKDMNFIYIIT